MLIFEQTCCLKKKIFTKKILEPSILVKRIVFRIE